MVGVASAVDAEFGRAAATAVFSADGADGELAQPLKPMTTATRAAATAIWRFMIILTEGG